MRDSKDSRTYRHTAAIGELRKEFVRADLDHDGRVNFDEFKQLLNGLESGMSESDMQIGFHELDTNRDGLIDCQEFIDWLSGD
jgi:Ca2+-binding EF-hand superfamily protein